MVLTEFVRTGIRAVAYNSRLSNICSGLARRLDGVQGVIAPQILLCLHGRKGEQLLITEHEE